MQTKNQGWERTLLAVHLLSGLCLSMV